MSDSSLSLSPQFLAEDIGPTIVATASLMIIFSTIFIALRYYARYLTQTKFGIEDVIIPLAYIAELGLCITGIVMVKKAGTGRHMAYIQMTDSAKLPEHYKGIMIIEMLHLPAVAFSKLCVVVLYLRVFTNKYARMATWVLIYAIIATWLSYTVAACFQCTPFAFNWDKSIPNGRCFNVFIFSQSSSVPNIVTDFVVLLLPIRTVMELKISMGRRIGLLAIFLTGSIGIIASIIRTVVLSGIDPRADVTFSHTEIVNWSIIEPGMYLLAACALSFKPLFRIIAKTLHLESLLTHTRSTLGRHIGKTGKTGKTSSTKSSLRMETFKSDQSGFTKLHSGKDGGDEEMNVGTKDQDGPRVHVLKAMDGDGDPDTKSTNESWYEEGDEDDKTPSSKES
ncbi:hypothetical protein BCR34DRAFT_482258 [Clohesyomyces aquaticus]|uniref:Rhodopsin domain-containing protein n=1 Tax=Clohesyomyces aquaticus TaxID=1231657 RepID=A0A1Y1ZR72_9PLEO|nr:hypothetical protein BCR34DRAFT_482258 [Clohesyomyces aquaticus]